MSADLSFVISVRDVSNHINRFRFDRREWKRELDNYEYRYVLQTDAMIMSINFDDAEDLLNFCKIDFSEYKEKVDYDDDYDALSYYMDLDDLVPVTLPEDFNALDDDIDVLVEIWL